MSKLDEVKALFDDIRENENDLDFAVNCAGIPGPMGSYVSNRPFLMGEHDALRNNIYGTLFSLMYELRFMTEKNHSGSIVSISSIDGLHGTPDGALYSASKAAIVGLTRSIALEHVPRSSAPLIRVNAIAPGLINTSFTWQQVKWDADNTTEPWEGDYITPDHPLWKQYGPDWIESLTGKHIASPKMIADPVLWLLSSDASYVTGVTLTVDRGDIA